MMEMEMGTMAWVDHLNEEHGAGTHWYVLVEGGAE